MSEDEASGARESMSIKDVNNLARTIYDATDFIKATEQTESDLGSIGKNGDEIESILGRIVARTPVREYLKDLEKYRSSVGVAGRVADKIYSRFPELRPEQNNS